MLEIVTRGFVEHRLDINKLSVNADNTELYFARANAAIAYALQYRLIVSFYIRTDKYTYNPFTGGLSND